MAVAICERGSRKARSGGNGPCMPGVEIWLSPTIFCHDSGSASEAWRDRTGPSRAVDRAQGGTQAPAAPFPDSPVAANWLPSRTSGCKNTTALSLRTMCGGQNFMRLRREPQKRPASAAPVRRQPVSASFLRPAPAGVIAARRDGGTEDFQNTINPGYPPISAIHAIITGCSQTPRCHYCISFDKRNLSVMMEDSLVVSCGARNRKILRLQYPISQ